MPGLDCDRGFVVQVKRWVIGLAFAWVRANFRAGREVVGFA
ncbi:MAG: hypothetical protein AAF913_08190 [Pseudomonadota bacterium]